MLYYTKPDYTLYYDVTLLTIGLLHTMIHYTTLHL